MRRYHSDSEKQEELLSHPLCGGIHGRQSHLPFRYFAALKGFPRRFGMFYDVNVSLFPIAFMHNKNPHPLGQEKEAFCLCPQLQEKPRVKSVNAPCRGFPICL